MTNPKSLYSIVDLPSEIKVGEFCTVQITAPLVRRSDDWIGIYPRSIPSVPGVSCGRWVQIPAPAPDAVPGSAETLSIAFPPSKLPNHPGDFEVRLHSGKFNSYRVRASARLVVVAQPVSRYKRFGFLLVLIAIVALFQHLLNAKGVCYYQDPSRPDAFEDLFVSLTAPLNRYLADHPATAQLAQALSSFVLDVTLLLLLTLGAMRRSTIRPFLALFVFMTLRFVAQSIATFPCPPGFLWPTGVIFEIPIPTLFVDYHPANDFFFRFVCCYFYFIYVF